MKRFTLITYTALLCLTAPLFCIASDISRDVRGGDGNNFFELSAGVGYGKSDRLHKDEEEDEGFGINLGLGGEYHFKGFFVEAIQDSYSGLNFGYSLWADNKLQVDLIIFNVYGTLTTDNEITPGMSEQERDKRLIERDTISVNGGVRGTYYWRDNIIQMRLEDDYSEHDAGPQGSLLLGRAWQVRNWNIHGLTGLHWHSQQRTEYLWGVSSLEATNQFPAYSPSSALNYSFELGLTYPISENWVWRTRALVFLLDDEITNSPLTNGDWSGGISTYVSYVF